MTGAWKSDFFLVKKHPLILCRFKILIKMLNRLTMDALSGREETLDCKLHWYPKCYNHITLFVGSKPSVTLVVIDKFQTSRVLLYKRGNFVYHHWEGSTFK